MDDTLLKPLKVNIERSMNLFHNPNEVFSGRTSLWNEACNVFETYSTSELIFGRGTRSYLSEPALISNNLKKTGKGSTPHNFFLSALLEGGILKATLIILIVIVWFAQIIKKLKFVNLWKKNVILGSFLLWLLSVTISGKDFFNSKIAYLVLIVYAILENDRVSDSELTLDQSE
jgi:O-antigen ligase